MELPQYQGLSDMDATDSTRPGLWDTEGADYDCDCAGPPPSFHLSAPPRPPSLHEGADCSETPPLEDPCATLSVIDDPDPYYGHPVMPPLAIVVICSLLLLAMLLVATALLWKHKKKMQNLLPCKSSPQNHCDVTHGTGVIYEDLTNIRPRVLPQPSMEMLDVKTRGNYPHSYPVITHTHSPVFICSPSQDLYNPVYEELSNGSGEREESDPESEEGPPATVSEDEFAEDELSLGEGGGRNGLGAMSSSLQGSTGNDLCRDVDSSDGDDRSRFLCSRNLSLPPGQRRPPRGQRGLRPHSLDRRRRHKGPECGEFHEGLLLDALLHMYPPPPPHDPHRLPYVLPVPGPTQYLPQHSHPLTTFRTPSHDSDSGYSNHTSGGGQGSTRGRKDQRYFTTSDFVLS